MVCVRYKFETGHAVETQLPASGGFISKDRSAEELITVRAFISHRAIKFLIDRNLQRHLFE